MSRGDGSKRRKRDFKPGSNDDRRNLDLIQGVTLLRNEPLDLLQRTPSQLSIKPLTKGLNSRVRRPRIPGSLWDRMYRSISPTGPGLILDSSTTVLSRTPSAPAAGFCRFSIKSGKLKSSRSVNATTTHRRKSDHPFPQLINYAPNRLEDHQEEPLSGDAQGRLELKCIAGERMSNSQHVVQTRDGNWAVRRSGASRA